MVTLREGITLAVVSATALFFVSAMLAMRASASGEQRGVIVRRIALIWLCAAGAVASGLGARMLMGGYLLDASLNLTGGGVDVERGPGALWPAAIALGAMVALLLVALRQARLLGAGDLPAPDRSEPSGRQDGPDG